MKKVISEKEFREWLYKNIEIQFLKQQQEIEEHKKTIEEMHNIFHALIDEIRKINNE